MTSGQHPADLDPSELALAFFDACPEMIAVLDREGRVLRANAAWEAALGPSPRSERLVERVPEDQQSWLTHHLDTIPNGMWSGPLRTAAGGVARFALRWNRDARGRYHVVARQLLPQETASQESAERARALVRQTDLAVIEMSASGVVVSWNRAAEAMFGYTEAEAVGSFNEALVGAPEVVVDYQGLTEQMLSTGVARYLGPNRRKDGQRITCAWSTVLLRDDQGAPIGLTALAQDITAVEAQRRDLEERTNLLRVVLENTPVVLWAVDGAGRFTLSTGSALRGLGLAEGEAVGRDAFEMYASFPEIVATIRGALAGVSGMSRPTVAGRDWETFVLPVRDDKGEVNGAIGLSLDVTERGNLERQLREHIAELERQRGTIRAMSTPILQVWDEVLALPVIGHVDAARAEAIMDALLDAIVRTGARYAILDVTGVDAVDEATVHHVARLLRAVALLGSQGILTGVRPAVAQHLVALGADLPGVPTLSNLRAGLHRCLREIARDARAPRGGGPGR